MADPDDEDYESLVTDPVQHAVIADSDPPERLVILRHKTSRAVRSRVDPEATQAPDDAARRVGR